ncbi:MAG: glycoside hydrolase family protein [Rikenellaceae bacterium]
MLKVNRMGIIAALCAFAVSCAAPEQPKGELDFTKILPTVFDKSNVVEFDDYNIWGTNIVKGKDGKYHAIYSRWAKSRGHLAWVTHSEIAHATADKLTGPYTFQNLVLPPRGREFWDGDVTHNPHLLEYNGKYYLYHMGNYGSGYWDETPDTLMPKPKDDEWWVNRNNQRVGLAIADDINGEWKRFPKPLIDIDSTQVMTSTPTISIRPDGKFLLAYKYVEKSDNKLKGGRVIHVTALSDSPEGPFVKTGRPFITHPTASFAIDDHVEWFQDGRYYCIAKDSRGVMSEYGEGATLLFVSDEEGLDWRASENFLVLSPGVLNYDDDSTVLCDRTADMPKLYMEDGKLKALIFATLPKDGDDSFVTITPVDTDLGYDNN